MYHAGDLRQAVAVHANIKYSLSTGRGAVVLHREGEARDEGVEDELPGDGPLDSEPQMTVSAKLRYGSGPSSMLIPVSAIETQNFYKNVKDICGHFLRFERQSFRGAVGAFPHLSVD